MDRMTQEYLQSELSIQLGTKRNIEDLIHAIDAANCEVRDADLILAKIHLPVATSPLSVDLVICTPEELGFKNGTDFRSLCNQARKQGLDLCPPEVAFQLCLQYNHYQLGERLTIVTEGIAVSRGAMVSCQVGRDYGGRVWTDRDVGHDDCPIPDKNVVTYDDIADGIERLTDGAIEHAN